MVDVLGGRRFLSYMTDAAEGVGLVSMETEGMELK